LTINPRVYIFNMTDVVYILGLTLENVNVEHEIKIKKPSNELRRFVENVPSLSNPDFISGLELLYSLKSLIGA